MIYLLLNAPRSKMRLITLCYDTLVLPLAIYSELALRYGEWVFNISQATAMTILITTVLSLIVFVRSGLYQAVIRYMAAKTFGTMAIGT